MRIPLFYERLSKGWGKSYVAGIGTYTHTLLGTKPLSSGALRND